MQVSAVVKLHAFLVQFPQEQRVRLAETNIHIALSFFPRHTGVKLVDGLDFDFASQVSTHKFFNNGTYPLADNQNCRWRASA